jgi:diguanylate cyclase (GGDEF)-like protein
MRRTTVERPSLGDDQERSSVSTEGLRAAATQWMRAIRIADRRASQPAAHGDRPLERHKVLWVAYCVLMALLIAYVISLAVRRPDQQWPWLDSWLVTAFEIVASLMCIARGLLKRPGRAVPLFLGFAVLSWALGDLVLAIESTGGATPPTPSLADAFWLCFYPLAYAGTVLLLRRALGGLARPNWLDGVVAGLGAAAVCATFAFRTILRSTGGGAPAAIVNLAYPIGDLLLLSLVVGGTTLLTRNRRGPWLLLALGITVNIVGDTFALLPAADATQVGTAFNDFAWPVSILLISMAMWLRPVHPDPLRAPRLAGFTLPGIGAAVGLVILVIGTLHRITDVALGLAIATLVVVGVRLSISARRLRMLTEENHRHAVTDELTGLGNRRQLFSVLDSFFAEPVSDELDRELAFLFIDLNHFKEINDSFGHPAGDELLRQLGPRLRRAVRGSDMVVRLGGDEFAVVLVDAGAAHAEVVASRIFEELSQPIALQMVEAQVGASIGIALAPSDATDCTSLLWCADVAMYRAKLSDTPFVFYDHDLDGGENRLRLADELRAAVDLDQFVLHYQPQLDLRTGEVIAVEALLRWLHPTLGIVPPLKFLPLAEESGLIEPLTALVFDKALAQCAAWRAAGSNLSVSVNISATNLLDAGLSDLVRDLLERHGVPASALVIEITETSVITDFEASRAAIERLRDLGAVVSIDDFGAGFTSLAHLGSLAVGELKLDNMFVTGLGAGDKPRDLELVRATIDFGHAMGLRVVAEGIEDAATLDLLRNLGCDVAQGFYISRPMPADQLAFQGDGRTVASPQYVG